MLIIYETVYIPQTGPDEVRVIRASSGPLHIRHLSNIEYVGLLKKNITHKNLTPTLCIYK